GLLAVIFGLGAHTPLFRVFYEAVPGIKNFRAPSMMLFWLATALLVMSADTLSRLTRGVKGASSADRKRWGKRLLQVGLGFSGLFIVLGLAPGIAFGIWDVLFSAEGASNVANRVNAESAFALGALRTGVLLAVTCVDLMWVNSSFIKTYDPGRVMASEPAVELLKADTSAHRIFGLPGTYERSFMQYHGIETTDGWTDNEYRLYREFRGGD